MTEKFILDATAGFRMMWFNKHHPNVLYVDQRPECEPDQIADFTHLDYPDESFKLVVFDPPHIIDKTGTNRTGQLNDFGSLCAETWQNDLRKGFREVWRVLQNYGVLIFKWSSQQVPSNQVLKLISQEPLFYQVTSNKRRQNSHSDYQTLWFCFMKIPKPEYCASHATCEEDI